MASSNETTLSKYITGSMSLSDTLTAFCADVEKQYAKAHNTDDIEELLWKAWRTVTHQASLSHSQESRQALVNFLLAIQQRPDLVSNGETCIVHDGVVWKDLPVFGMQMREAWNTVPTETSTPSDSSKWVNLNAWTATLVATVQAQNLSSPDLSLHAIWTIRTALEEEDENANDPALQAAAAWFIHASTCLHQLCGTAKRFDGKVARPGSLFHNREWRGFSLDRWAVWGERMRKAERSVDDGGVAEALREALAAMEAVG